MIPPTDPGQPPRPSAEELFEGFLVEYGEGDDVAFARICGEHPERADALQRLRSAWRRMGRAVDALDEQLDGPPRGPPASAAPIGPVDASPASVELDLSAAAPDDRPGPSPVEAALERLGRREPGYVSDREIGRGAMGRILRVWDERLRRTLAMKVLLDDDRAGDETARRRLARFLDEAQITGQLDHPGIVPVHDVGLDAEGQLYFTMRLVRGRSLRALLDLARDGTDGWSVPRTLGVILKVCEAMAYAHSKGVVHRDLKPSNVMVGRFGETYVMDWGLAKVVGRQRTPSAPPGMSETALGSDPSTSASEIHTERRADGDASPGSPLQTLAGTVVGTPAYMAPEQAAGRLDEVGPPTDVYAVGAMLYHLLAGHMPYVAEDERATPRQVLDRVRAGPPHPLHHVRPRVPAELIAICSRAMARRPDDRYPDMNAMADELRAHLEGRVVASHAVGALVELRKWIVRNRAFAAVLFLAVVGLAAFTVALLAASDDLEARNESLGTALDDARRLQREADAASDAARLAAAEADRAREAAETSAVEARRNAYGVAIAAADAALRSGDVAEARRLLADCAPDVRGWEWQHLTLRLDPSLAVLRGHAGPLADVAFAPGSRIAATAGWDGTARLWNGDDGGLLLNLDHGDQALTAVAFSPDGTRLAVAGHAHRVSLWSVPSGEPLGVQHVSPPLVDVPASVTCLAYAPDGRQLYAGTDQRRLVALDAISGRRREFPRLHSGALIAVAIHEDGALALTGSEDRTAILWDTASGDQRQVLFGHEAPVSAVAFAPAAGGPLIATGAEDGTIQLFSTEGGRLLRSLAGHAAAVRDLVFAPDGSWLASASDDRGVRLWDPYDGRLLATLRGHDEGLTALAVDADGQRLASASADGTARLWDTRYRGAVSWLTGHVDRIESLAVSPADALLVSAGWDGRAHLWDVDLADPVAARDLPADAARVAFSPDGSLVATADATPGADRPHDVHLWDERQLADLASVPRRLRGHEDAVRAVTFSPDGVRLASGGNDRTARLWDVASGASGPVLSHGGWVSALVFHPEGDWLASGAHDESVRLWDPRDGRELARWDGLGEAVTGLACSADGALLAVGTTDGRLALLDGHDLTLRRELSGHHGDVLALAFHPSQPRLASSARDGSVRLWEPDGGLRLLELRPESAARDLAFSGDGERLFLAVGSAVAVYETRPPRATWELRRATHALRDRAATLVDGLFDQLIDPRDVTEALRGDDTLDGALRDEALRQARNMGRDPSQLAAAAFAVLSDPRAGPRENLVARRQARAALSLADDDPRLISLVGLAHFRCGDDRQAIRLLEEATLLNQRAPSYPVSWDLFFIAMANQRLGYLNTARTFLARARVEAELDGVDERETTLAFASEARALIEGG